MKELVQKRIAVIVGILFIVLSNFLPFLAFAQDEVPLFPYDTVQVDGEEKEKNAVVLERKKGTSTAHIISLKGNADGKLSITKTSEFMVEPLAAETNITTRQEDGKEIIEIPLIQGKVTSFKLTLTGEGTSQALNATFTPTEKETLPEDLAEPQLALAPFTFQLAEIKTMAETPAETSSSSAAKTTEGQKEKAAAPKTAAPAIPPIQRAPIGATILKTGLIGTCKYELDNSNTLTIFPGEMDPAVKPAGSVDMATIRKIYSKQVSYIQFVSDSSGGKIIAPKDSSKLFEGITTLSGPNAFDSLRTIDFGGNFDTSNVVNMSGMFANDTDLSELSDLSSWDTSNVVDMSAMFESVNNLTKLSGLSSWDVANVTNMSEMFSGMYNIASLDGIANWNTKKVENMRALFSNNRRITSLSFMQNWDVSHVKSLGNMFYGCNNLVTVGDLSGWDISSTKSIGGMFEDCTSLSTVGNITNWNTSNVTDMAYMFANANKITTEEIGDLGSWDTSRVEKFDRQFYNTASLSTLNFKNWQMGSENYYSTTGEMLEGSGITKILLGDRIYSDIKLPVYKLGRDSADKSNWKLWCGVGSEFGGSESPQNPEGEILTWDQYDRYERIHDELSHPDTYVIAKPKTKTVDIAVKDAWDQSIGIGGVQFYLYNRRVGYSSLFNSSFDIFRNKLKSEFLTDSAGKILVQNIPATKFYCYAVYQSVSESPEANSKYWPLLPTPDLNNDQNPKTIELEENKATGTIIPKPDNPIYMVPRVSIRINATDEKGKPVAGVKLELHDKNGNVVTKLGSKNFVQPITGKDGTVTIKDYYIENPEDYSLQLVKPLPIGFDPANGEIFTADTTTPSKTLVHFGGEYNIDVKLKQAEVVLPMTGSDDLGDWGTVLFGAGDLALAGMIFKTIKRKYGLR
ncbi:BspA family leucine-rich repeat surface protein [Enterococcus hirae]|nr:BspA family leucine-rich repeat surface protein [Enterococcus hirae]